MKSICELERCDFKNNICCSECELVNACDDRCNYMDDLEEEGCRYIGIDECE